MRLAFPAAALVLLTWTGRATAQTPTPLPPAHPQAPPATPPAQSQTLAPSLPPEDSLRLTRAQAVAHALTYNPQLDVARQQTAQARAGKVIGLGVPDVDVSASLDNEPHLFQLGQAGAKNVGLGIVVPFVDKFRLRNAIGNADIHSAEYNYAQVHQIIAAQTAQQYDSVLMAVRQRADLLTSRELSADFLKRTNARFEAGTVPRLDVIRAQVDVAQADNDLIANERVIANAQAGLNRFLNRALGAPVMTLDSLDVPPYLPSLDRVERYALDNRPELGALKSQIAGARATTRLAKEFWVPDFTVGAERDYGQSAPATFSAGVVFPFPIIPWAHTRGEIAQDAFRERELTATQIDLRAAIGQDVRNAYAAASTSLRQAIYIRDQLLPAATAAFKAASASYAIGGSSALEVIDARRTLLDAQSQYTSALAAASIARWDLERAIGTTLDTFGPGTAP